MKRGKKSKKKKYKRKEAPLPHKLQETELVGLEAPQDIIELAFFSLHVKEEQPTKLVLIGEFESGRTTLMEKYRNTKGVIVRRRLTAYGITRELVKNELSVLYEKPMILGTLMIYDFVNTLTFKQNTVESTIEFLSALFEEGLSAESAYWIAGDDLKPFDGLKGGLVAGINTFGFFTSTGQVKKQLYGGGWLSRMIPFSFDISKHLNSKISDSISRSEYRSDKKFVEFINLRFPTERIDVRLPRCHSLEIKDIAFDVAQEINDSLKHFKLKGHRLQKALMTLTKASALRDGRKIVIERDVERVRYLSQWMNLKLNKLRMDYPFK